MTMSELPPLIPRTVLFGNPERLSPRISPDGSRLAYIAPVDGVLNVWVGDRDGNHAAPVTQDEERGIRDFHWAYDGKHLLYIQDTGGDENWHLYGTDLETRETVDLTPFEGVQAQVIEIDKHFPNDVLVAINKDNPQLHDAYRLDLRSGELELVAQNPGFVGWLADAQFKIRCGVTPSPDGGMTVLVRDDDVTDDWRPVLSVSADDGLTTAPVAFTLDGQGLYVISSVGVNAARLVRLPLDGRPPEVLAEDEQFDVTTLRLDPDTHVPQVVVFAKERNHYVPMSSEAEEDLAVLRETAHGDPSIENSTADDRTWIVSYTSDNAPVTYYRYERDSKVMTKLFVARPALQDYQLASMEPFEYKSRDGLTIHGYLTFPPNIPRHKLPTILNIHGGPWARDTWGYNAEAQWMANRGYLVVQVNFRGSTGFGKDFVNAGDKAWGAEMHNDLLDAIDWVTERGYADPGRIAAYGGSYGGYAALVAAAFTPERFRCAVDVVGPSNLKTLIESIPPYWEPMIAQFHERVGNPGTEEEFLWERSPLSKAENISIPLMIAQGANDPRVKVAESEQIVAALTEKGIPHEYLLFADEGHGFAKPENRLRFCAAAEKFLAAHLGGRMEE